MVRSLTKLAFLGLASLIIAGCGNYGEVMQGRTVAFNDTTKEVTIIRDTLKNGPADYSTLPAVTFKLPDSPSETGALPTAGLLMDLNEKDSVVTMYNPEEKGFEKIPFTMKEKQEKVDLANKHPLVYDTINDVPRVFPIIDKDSGTVTLYFGELKTLFTIKVDQDTLDKYAASGWNRGDIVRSYYKQTNKSLRFMNVTKTNIFKK